MVYIQLAACGGGTVELVFWSIGFGRVVRFVRCFESSN
jgi:hypothetical protein